MLTREQKKQIVRDLREKFRAKRVAVFCNFKGISAQKQRELRRKIKENKGEIFVTKRRLLQRALKEEKIEFPEITGSVMIGVSDDEILLPKILYNFSKKKLDSKKENLNFIGGISKQDEKYRILSEKELEELAKLPSREELLQKLIWALRAPISNLEFVLKGNFQKLVYILSEINQ